MVRGIRAAISEMRSPSKNVRQIEGVTTTLYIRLVRLVKIFHAIIFLIYDHSNVNRNTSRTEAKIDRLTRFRSRFSRPVHGDFNSFVVRGHLRWIRIYRYGKGETFTCNT